jgi:hypothetical protein
MATEAQIAANRENARHSTGPVTEEGRVKVSQNSPRTQTEGSAYRPEPSDPTNAGSQTGLFTERDFVRPDESAAYDELTIELRNELDPGSMLEHVHFNEVLAAAWRLQRCNKLEFRLVDATLENQSDPMADEANAKLQRTIDRARIQSHNLLLKATKELNRLRAERLARPQAPPVPRQLTLEEMEIKAAEIRARRKAEQSQSAPPAPAGPDYESMPPYGEDPIDGEIEAILASMRNLHDVVEARITEQTQSANAENPHAAEHLPEMAPSAGGITEQSQSNPVPGAAGKAQGAPDSPGAAHSKAPAGSAARRLTLSPRKAAIGRNAACPCNSGKKYKRCCGFARPDAMKTAA